jgi:hypothetical protein
MHLFTTMLCISSTARLCISSTARLGYISSTAIGYASHSQPCYISCTSGQFLIHSYRLCISSTARLCISSTARLHLIHNLATFHSQPHCKKSRQTFRCPFKESLSHEGLVRQHCISLVSLVDNISYYHFSFLIPFLL